MGSVIDEVSRCLRMKSITIPPNNYWLKSCVECFKEQGNYSVKELTELVYQQWLLADLSDIGVQVLPDNCLSAGKTILQGRYAVQLNYFVNIALSFHKQMQKIRRPEVMKNLEVDSENTFNAKDAHVSGNRVLKIEITDGVITVIGFEDQVISILQEPLVPGKKAILTGPIECRKGILFLKPCNLRILGGEVDSLHVQNATENILARALKLPENPDPYHLASGNELNPGCNNTKVSSEPFDDDDEALMMLADVIENEVATVDTSNGTKNLNVRTDQSQRNITSSISNSGQHLTNNMSKKSIYNQSSASSNDPLSTDDFDDDMAELEQKIISQNRKESIDFDDYFEALEGQTNIPENSNTVTNSSRSVHSSNMTETLVFDLASSKKQFEEITDLKKKLNESYSTNKIRTSSSAGSPSNSMKEKKIIFDYLSDNQSPLTEIREETENKLNHSISEENDDSNASFFTHDPFPPIRRPSVVKTSARVIKVLEKPKLKGDKWSVSAIVAARGIELEVSFSSEVIDKIFKISAAEITSRKAELVSNPSLKQKVNETLKNSQRRFSTLSCTMVFSFNDAISKPVIVDVE